MKFINNGNSFLLSAPASIFAAEIKNELKRHTMFNGEKKQIIQSKRLADALFILWAGGAALLSYSLVYALRKPFTAAGFDGLDFFGMDYKTATSIEKNIALIAVVGRGMKNAKGTAAAVFMALAEKDINIRMIDQGSSALNIIVGVDNADFEKSIQTIYDKFVI